ncbi:hypothetical protein B0O80DRAFT_460956 [Mortierella sp. GBAus27b]|nr:hypothetical protein B0O80DRAFT_460956 [Mortierella sp. GBAus27b]
MHAGKPNKVQAKRTCPSPDSSMSAQVSSLRKAIEEKQKAQQNPPLHIVRSIVKNFGTRQPGVPTKHMYKGVNRDVNTSPQTQEVPVIESRSSSRRPSQSKTMAPAQSQLPGQEQDLGAQRFPGFIVLPRAVGLSGNRDFAEQFKLYFLCFCSAHNAPDGSKRLHLTLHEGFNLKSSKMFFQRYGASVLSLMRMIKNTPTGIDLIVAPTMTSRIADDMDSVQNHMVYLNNHFVPLLDESIDFLDSIKDNHASWRESTEDHPQEDLKVTDLEPYLNTNDSDHVVLRRFINSKGNRVCPGGGRLVHRSSTLSHLQFLVSANGTYHRESGKIEVAIESKDKAKTFYTAMKKTDDVRELVFTFKWDATTTDLQDFANAVISVNVAHLTVIGTYFKDPTTRGGVKQSQRFDPLARLASSPSLQSFRLEGFERFFSHINVSSLGSSSHLQVLSVPLQDAAMDLTSLLQLYPALTTLEVKLHRQDLITVATSNILRMLPNLRKLKIDRHSLSVSANVSQGKILDVVLATDQLNNLDSDDHKFIQQNRGTKQAIQYVARKDERNRLNVIIPTLEISHHIRIGYEGGRTLDMAATHGWSLRELADLVMSESSGQPESLSVDSQRLSFTATVSQGNLQGMDMRIGRLNDLSSDDLAFMQQDNLTRLVIRDGPSKTDEDDLASILSHNPSLTRLEIKSTNECSLAADGVSEMELQDFVKLVTPHNRCSMAIGSDEYSVTVGISLGVIQEVDLTIVQLKDLGASGFRCIHKDYITRLSIKRTPQEEDEDQLVDILHQYKQLQHLRIGCHADRFHAVVDLVTQERNRGEQGSSSLQTFELMRENLIPFDIVASCDQDIYIASCLSFSENSNVVNMNTWIRLTGQDVVAHHDTVQHFLRQYGWSIVSFDAGRTYTNTLSDILLCIQHTRPSQLANLRINSCEARVDLMDQVIKQSPNFKSLGLYANLDDESQFETTMMLLRRGSKLSSLHLHGNSAVRWTEIATTFLSRTCFPVLESFEVSLEPDQEPLSQKCLVWIISMIMCGKVTALRKIMLRNVRLEPHYFWSSLLGNDIVNWSALEHLDLAGSNFGHPELKFLVDSVANKKKQRTPVALRTLIVTSPGGTKEADSQAFKALVTELRQVVPSINIVERAAL